MRGAWFPDALPEPQLAWRGDERPALEYIVKFTIGAEAVMARGERRKAPPVSIALAETDRSTFEAEARRRKAGLSTTIRSLAAERVEQLRQERQRERARRWQLAQLDDLIAEIEHDGFREVSRDQINAAFAGSAARSRRRAHAVARE